MLFKHLDRYPTKVARQGRHRCYRYANYKVAKSETVSVFDLEVAYSHFEMGVYLS